MKLLYGPPAIRQFNNRLALARGGGAACVVIDEIAAPVAGNTFTHLADGTVAFTVSTLTTGADMRVLVRQQDASNYWRIVINATGQLNLQEIVGGGSAGVHRTSVNNTVTAGQRVAIEMEGATITGYVEGVQIWTYGSASNFQSATSGSVNQVGDGSFSDLRTWTVACGETDFLA